MSTEEKVIPKQVDEQLNKRLDEKVDEKLESLPKPIPPAEMDRLLEMNGKLQVAEFIQHDCNNDNCGICKMKNTIDSEAFKRGAVAGVKLGRKYPNLKVE